MTRQFDVVTNPSLQSRDRVPYLLVLQSHHLSSLETVIVAPLIRLDLVQPDGATSLPVDFAGQSLTLAVGLLANIERRLLGRALGTLGDRDYEIQRALDRIFTGF